MKKTFVFTLIMLSVVVTRGQNLNYVPPSPVVDSFSPASGQSGTTVTIYGQWFDQGTNPPTTVRFGTVQAPVQSFTGTTVVATVPNVANGNYQISVTTKWGTGYSSGAFQVTNPTTSVTFIHGWRSNGAVWQDAVNQLASNYFIAPSTPSYNSVDLIPTIATTMLNQNQVPNNTVVVAHSMGGIIAREIQRRPENAGRIKALITTGTPHTGAPIAGNVGNALPLAALWIDDAAAGFYGLFGANYDAGFVSGYLAKAIGLMEYVQFVFNNSVPTAAQLIPNSPYMQSLNSNPASTLPAAHYTIYGEEDHQSLWRLADANSASNRIENGSGVSTNSAFQTIYFTNSIVCYIVAHFNYQYHLQTGSAAAYMAAARYYAGAQGFWRGYLSFSEYQQYQYDYYLVGSLIYNGSNFQYVSLDDALIPTYSQAPFYVNVQRRIRAAHANHTEETTTHPDAINAIKTALSKPDVGVTER